MFRTVALSIVRSFSLYTQQWYMSYSFADSLRTGSGRKCVPSWSCSQAVSKPVWHIPLLCVQWKIPDDGQRNCPKHVPSWSCSQAVSKTVWHIPLLCLQWKIPDDGQRNCPKHVEFHSKNKLEKLVHLVGFIVRNLTRCTVTWTSDCSGISLADYKELETIVTRSRDSAFGTVTVVRVRLVKSKRLFQVKRTGRLHVSFSPILNGYCRLFPRK
jgi:hypothetical protein